MEAVKEAIQRRLQPDEDWEARKIKESENKLQVPVRVRPPFQRGRTDPSVLSISRLEPPPLAFDTLDEPAPEIETDPVLLPAVDSRKRREPDFLPFREPALQRELMNIFDPEQWKLKLAIGCGSLAAFLLIIGVFPAALVCGLFALAQFISWKWRRRALENCGEFMTKKERKEDAYNVPESPSEMFVGKKKEIVDTKLVPGAIMKTYAMADRANASTSKSGAFSNDSYRLAIEGLQKLGMTETQFNRYVSNMKQLIAKSILAKLVKMLHMDQPLVVQMLAVPRAESYGEYVRNRIRAMSTQGLIGHLGDHGEMWRDKEWTSDMPSDNQIVLHILSIMFSYLMCGKKMTNVRPIFDQKYLFIKREREIEDVENDVLLCTDDFSQFYVYTKYKTQVPEKWYALPGRDSMYGALTLFFWFVKEKKNFFLEGADFADEPLCMERVFKRARIM